MIPCAACSRPNKDSALFCVGCGNRLAPHSATAQQRQALRETREMPNLARQTRLMALSDVRAEHQDQVRAAGLRDSGERRPSRDGAASTPSAQPAASLSTPTDDVPGGVPERPVSQLCKECQLITRTLMPFCQHCGRPLTNLQGSVQLAVRWSGGQQPSGDPAVFVLVSARPSIRFLSGAPQRNLGFLVDGSVLQGGSAALAGQRTQLVRRFLEHVVDEMGPGDYLTIGFFGLRTYLLVAGERVEDKKATKRLIEKKLESLDVGDGSLLADGLEQTLKEVRRNFSPDRVNRAIILTDSQVADQDASLRSCSLAAEQGITVSSMTLEHGDDHLMQALARVGHGKFYPSVEFRHIPEILSQELMTVRATFTTHAELYFHAAPGWAVSRAFKINPVITDLSSELSNPARAALKLADLQLYDEQTLLFELSPVRAEPNRTVIGRAEVVCDFPHEDVTNMTFSLPILVGRPQQAFSTHDPEVLRIVELLLAVFGA